MAKILSLVHVVSYNFCIVGTRFLSSASGGSSPGHVLLGRPQYNTKNKINLHIYV